MESSDVLEHLFDEKLLKILRLFYKEYDKEFYLREIAKKTNVAPASTFRILKKLMKLKLIKQIVIKRFKLYKLEDNEYTRFLGPVVKKGKQALEVFITRAKDLYGLDSIILQSGDTDKKANLIVIGSGINQDKIKNLCGQMLEEFNYRLTALVLEKEQFEQMDKMGLYPGKKKVIYKR